MNYSEEMMEVYKRFPIRKRHRFPRGGLPRRTGNVYYQAPSDGALAAAPLRSLSLPTPNSIASCTASKSDETQEPIRLPIVPVPKSELSPEFEKGVEKGDKSFACMVCRRVFTSKNYLKTHVSVVHDKAKVHECDICQRRFGMKQHRDVHVQMVHNKQLKHQCTECGQGFGTRSQLSVHNHIVHQKRPAFVCDHAQCDRIFLRQSILANHIRSVHENRRPHKCTHAECDASFGKRATLLNHIRKVHNKEKPFACTQCQRRFTEKCNLTRHVKLRHVPKNIPTSNLNSHLTIATAMAAFTPTTATAPNTAITPATATSIAHAKPTAS